MARLVLLTVASLFAIAMGAVLFGRAEAGAELVRAGGKHTGGGTVFVVTDTDYDGLFYFEVLGIPVDSPPCDGPTYAIRIREIPVTNYEFTVITPQGTIHGNFYTLADGRVLVDGTIDFDPPCEIHVGFSAYTEAILQGDLNCSGGTNNAPVPRANALPQGRPPGTEEAITVDDVLAYFDHLIFGPQPSATPAPSASGTPQPGSPGSCPVPGDLSATGVRNGDLDCDQELTYQDILRLLRHVGGLALQDPVPTADCVPVGHYYNVSQ